MALNNLVDTPLPIPVSSGGTGLNTGTTAFSPLCTGMSALSQFQTASSGLASAGWIYTSNGSGALPSFKPAPGVGTFSSISFQLFFTAGAFTYTPTANMVFCTITASGGGGGGGYGPSGTGKTAPAAGGDSGTYVKDLFFTAATIGASQSGTIGHAGAGGNSGSPTGATGGTTSMSGLGISCAGGVGGAGTSATTDAVHITVNPRSGPQVGGYGIATLSPLVGASGAGGSSTTGFSWDGLVGATTGGTGITGGFGSGGMGGLGLGGAGASAGASGGAGFVFVTEYIS